MQGLTEERIDLSKEVWVGATFFWKMADTLSKGILSECNDRDCDSFGRSIAANFVRIHELMEGKVKEETMTMNIENVCRISGNKMQSDSQNGNSYLIDEMHP